MGFTRNRRFLCSIIWVFDYEGLFLNPLTSLGSNILRQSLKESSAQNGDQYLPFLQTLQHHVENQNSNTYFNILPQIVPLDETLILSEPVRQIQDFTKTIDL